MRVFRIIILAIAVVGAAKSYAQSSDLDHRMENELQMNFPGIYFKHNSTDYAKMPYTVDSALKWIAKNFDDNINSLVMWHDSAESDFLINRRMQKIKFALRQYTKSTAYEIYVMGHEQKIARHTIQQANNDERKEYLLSLNSVFEVSKSKITSTVKYTGHILKPSIFCWGCWKSGFHWRTRMKMRKAIKKSR